MTAKFRVKHEVWLSTELERIKGFLLMPKFWGVKWTDDKLRHELAEIGLDYSKAEIQELNDELHKQETVEDVAEDVVTPE
jgi:hypothetical protein